MSNKAAWLIEAGSPLVVKSAPYTHPRENEIVVRNRAVAINPVDWAIQSLGTKLFPWTTFPTILGVDVSGEVVEIGSAISRFKVGDRVVGHATAYSRNGSTPGVFQLNTVLLEHMASPIPTSLPFENAAVLPLGVSTAACGLFQQDYLALQYPSIPPKPTGKALLVWGGSTSVGSNAIQLAVAAGYEVITTASPKNFDYVRKLGASLVFDRSSKTIVSDLINALKDKTIAGAIAIAREQAQECLDVVDKCTGNKFVAMAVPIPENIPDGVGAKFIFGSTLKDNEVSKVIYIDFLPQALAQGKYIAAPDPLVVGEGLESVQLAFDIQKNGVSAQKVVVSL